MPDCEMMPCVTSPFRCPSTFHTTPVSLAWVTVAVNCCVPPPACSVAAAGEMVTTGSVGTAAPHPAQAIRSTKGDRRLIFEAMRTISSAASAAPGGPSLQQEGEALILVDGLDRGSARQQVVADRNEFKHHRPARMAAALQAPGRAGEQCHLQRRFDQPGALG